MGPRPSIGAATDDELVELVRTDEREAYGELYRRHVSAARSTARWMLHSSQDADDIVSEAFAGALAALRNGSGPRNNFRFYLLASVRNGCMRRNKKSRSTPIDPTTLSDIAPAVEPAFGFAESNTVARAFSTLSPRWQQMLWLTEVERRPVGDVAKEMRMSASAVSSVSQRARHAFASAYLNEHVEVATDPQCAVFGPRLGKYVRGEAGELDTRRIEHHLETCAPCTKVVRDLEDVNACLRELQLPGGLTGVGAAALVVTGAAGSGSTVALGGWAASALGGWLVKAAIVALVAAPLVAADSPHGNSATSVGATTSIPAPGSGLAGGVLPGGGSAGTTPIGGAGAGTTGTAGGTGTGTGGGTGTGTAGGAGAAPPLGAIDPTAPGLTLPDGTPALGGSVPIGSSGTLPGVTVPGLPGVTVPSVTVPGLPGAIITIPGGVGVLVTTPAGGGVGVGVTTPIGAAAATVATVGVGVGAGVTTVAGSGGVIVGVGPGGANAGGSVSGGSVSGGSTTVTVGVTVGSGGVSGGGGVVGPPITVAVTIPRATVPPVTVPPVTVPRVTVPPVTVPPVTIPPVNLPPVTLPPVTLPRVTVPPITVPPITIPPITIPPVTLPVTIPTLPHL